jgi:hypothetical protein
VKQLGDANYFPAFVMVLAACAFTLLSACAQTGVLTPKTTNEKIAAAIAAVTQIRSSATTLLIAKQISVEDAENVLRQTDAAIEAIKIARSLDEKNAQAKLQVTLTILNALDGYLATKHAVVGLTGLQPQPSMIEVKANR